MLRGCVVSVLCCFLWIPGCHRSPASSATGIIVSAGGFKSPDQKYNLHVSIDARNIVFYTITDIANNSQLASDTAGSH